MKVVIVGPAHPLRGGIADFNHALAKALSESGDQIEIFSFSVQYPNFLFPGKTQYTSDPAPIGIKIRTTINSVNPLSWFKTARLINQAKPDLVIIRYWLPFMGPCLGTIARLIHKRSRVIAIMDNVIPHEKRIGDKILTQYFITGCHGFMVMSGSVKADLESFNVRRPIAVSPHPIYSIFGPQAGRKEALQHLGLSGEYKYMLFFGFIRKYKGLLELLKSMAQPQMKDLPVKLIVAGEFYEDPEEYRNFIKENRLEQSVIFFDKFIPQDEVKFFFSAADLVVQPYLSATQSGITQIAYHFEKPMLVTRVGGLPEMVEDGKSGYVVEVDPSKIASSIADFFINERAASMQIGVKEFKKRFEWPNFVANLKQLFKQL